MKLKVMQIETMIASLARQKHLLVPMLLLGFVAVLVVPLPPGMLDILLAANISLAAVILLTTVYAKSPLDFSVFPALLLFTTLGRLVLNVASTRLILSADATTPEQGGSMAGYVIEAFGTFVAGSSIIVGGIIFLILVVVQFVVVTKGATRMSEVAARFTLDAMPGRQMAIDADLSTGLIDENTATNRRDNVMREADFYGAMDGASKFVRGDAIAGLVIIVINIVGGLAVGVAVKGWSIPEAASLFTRLTIGDGLASQIPSFLIAIAAGLIVARAGNRSSLGLEIPKQLVSQPAALGLVAGFLVLLSLTPLPTIPLLVLAAILGGLCWSSRKQIKEEKAQEITAQSQEVVEEPQPFQDSILRLELGSSLLSLASQEYKENVVDKMAVLRAEIALKLGIVIPSFRIKDDLQLQPNTYRIYLRGGVVGEGVVYRDRRMVVAGEDIGTNLEGIREREPVFGLSAIWVTEEVFQGLDELFVQAMGPVSVLMTHVANVVEHHAAELLTREEVANMVEDLRSTSPRLIDEVMGDSFTVSRLHHVLKALLHECVPVNDLQTIVEVASDGNGLSLEDCVEKVRCALRRQICANVSRAGTHGQQVIRCVVLPRDVELAVSRKSLSTEKFAAALHHAALPLVADGLPIVVVASNVTRKQLRKQIEKGSEDVVVLSREEIVPEVELQIVGSVETLGHTSRAS